MIVVWLFLAVPWVCLQFVIVVFPCHTHLLFVLCHNHPFLNLLTITTRFNLMQQAKKKKLTSLQNKISQMSAERNVFGQLAILSIEHNIDLELTL